MKQLLNFNDRCDTCSNIYSGINSVLIIFLIKSELGIAVDMNADFIKGCRSHDVFDVIYSELIFLTQFCI